MLPAPRPPLSARLSAALKTVFWSTGEGAAASFAAAWSFVSGLASGLAVWGATSYEALVRLATANPYCARALRLIAQTMAAVPVAVYRDGAPGEGAKEVPGHPLGGVLARPARGWTWRRTCEAIVWGLYCGGRVYVERTAPMTGPNRGRATSLRLWAPDRLRAVTRDAAGDVTAYTFRTRTGAPYTVSADDVLDLRVLDPADLEEGAMPILIAARRALVALERADEWNAGLAQGGGQVPGYFVPRLPDGQQLTPEQVASAQEQANAHEMRQARLNLPRVLSGLFSFERAGVSPREAEWLKGRTVSAREVAAVCGVPPALLGDEKGGSLTDAGVNSEVRALLLLTVLPLLDTVLAELSAWLLPPGERLAYDRDQIDALGEDVNGLWTRYREAVGVLVTAEEAREAIGYGGPLPESLAAPATQDAAGDGMPDMKALGSLSGDGFESLLSLIPAAN